MTAPDSRDSVERVVADMRAHVKRNGVFAAGGITEQWADRLQALARGPQQAGGEDWLSEAVAVVYPDTGLRNDEAALAIWRAHMYDTGGEPLFSADMVEALQAEVARLTGEAEKWHEEASGLAAARMAYASEFPLNADGEFDVGNIHANIRALKAALREAGRDAARFGVVIRSPDFQWNGRRWPMLDHDELRAAIDAALNGGQDDNA